MIQEVQFQHLRSPQDTFTFDEEAVVDSLALQ